MRSFGDAAIAGFLSAFVWNHTIESCLRYANAAGSMNITVPDGLTWNKGFDDLTNRIESGWKTKDMKIDEVVINGEVYVKKSTIKSEVFQEAYGMQGVLIRSYGSGVHFGLLKEEKDLLSGKQVTLINTRRIHYWVENASLSQIVDRGLTANINNRVSVSIPSNTITQVIEVMPLSEKIFKQLMEYPVWKK